MLNIEQIREHCLKRKGITEEFPFDEETLVFKVAGKIFLLASLESIPLQINIKCEPEKAVEFREKYDSVIPGYHMNKKHWNTIIINGTVPAMNVFEWIDDSYTLVVAGLKKSERRKLEKKSN